MQFCCYFIFCCHVSFFFQPYKKVNHFLVIFASRCQITFQILFVLNLPYLDCSFSCPLLWSVSTVLQFILSICSLSQPGIPNNAGLFSGAVKKLHQDLMLFCELLLLYICLYAECISCCVCRKVIFCLYIYWSPQFWCLKKAFWTFWLALDCHHYQYLSYIHTLLFLTTSCS